MHASLVGLSYQHWPPSTEVPLHPVSPQSLPASCSQQKIVRWSSGGCGWTVLVVFCLLVVVRGRESRS